MNTLTKCCVSKLLEGKCFLALLFLTSVLVTQASNAELIVRGGSTLSISNASILDVNCTDFSVDSGGVVNLISGDIENTLGVNLASGSVFNISGGTISDCRPQFSKQFLPSTIVSGGVSTLTYTIENLSPTAAIDLSFTDNLDALAPLNEVIVATPSNASTTCVNGSVMAPEGGVNIALSDAELAAGNTCSVSVDVTSTVTGTHPSTTSVLSSSAGDNDPASAELTVQGAVMGVPPGFSVVFSPDNIGPGSVSTVRYTIDNSFVGTPARDLAFTNTLPASVFVATPANVTTNCAPGFSGSVSASSGGNTISLSGYELGAFEFCSLSVDVTSSVVGVHTNGAVSLFSSAGSAMSSAEDLTVSMNYPGFSKSFSPSSVSFGDRSTLTFTVDNTLNTEPLGFISFDDQFPAGMVVADPANASSTCMGPFGLTVDAIPGSHRISFEASGAGFPGFEALLAGSMCNVTLDVIATGASELTNVTSDLTFGTGFSRFSGGKASDVLTVSRTDLAITQSFINDPTPPGSTSTLEFNIFNSDRNFLATNVSFTKDLTTFIPSMAGLTFNSLLSNTCGGAITGVGTGAISFMGGTLPPQGACSIQVDLSIPSATTPGTYVGTTSAVTAIIDDSPVVGNMASDALHAEPVPLLTKTFIDDPVNPGDSVVLEFTVTNTSTTSSATDIEFEDIFETVLFSADVTPGDDCLGPGSTCAFVPLFNPSSFCDPCDAIPARLTVSGGSLAPAGMAGDSATFQITLNVSADAPTGIYENSTSSITATVDGATRTGRPASDAFSVIGAPSLSKVFVDDPVAPGDTVTLEFTLSHSPDAAGDATGITFTDDLSTVLTGLTANLPSLPDPPCGPGSGLQGSAVDTLLTLSGGTLSPGQECTFSVVLNVPASTAIGNYANTTSDVSATVNGLPVSAAPGSAELMVASFMFSKEFIGDPVIPGDSVTLRFSLENLDATNDATAISFSDDLARVLPGVPDLTLLSVLPVSACGGTLSVIGSGFLIFSGGALAAGDPPCSFDLDLGVPTGAADGIYPSTSGNLTAVLDGAVSEFAPEIDALIVDSKLLSISKEFIGNEPVLADSSASLLFTITNSDATRSASAISFTDDLGVVISGLVIDSVQEPSDCTIGGAVFGGFNTALFSVSNLTLAPGASCTVLVNMLVPEGATGGTYINTTSGVNGLINGLPVTGDPASDTFTVTDLDISFSKSFDASPVLAGGNTTLSFTITNNGDEAVNSLAFTDDLESVLTGLVVTGLPVNDVCGTGSTLSGTSLLTLTGASLGANGTSCSFDVALSVPISAAPDMYSNTTSDLTILGQFAASPAIADLTIDPTPPDFSKSFIPDTVSDNTVSTLNFVIDNALSPIEAITLNFSDNLPAGLVIAPVANSATSCTGGVLTAVPGASVVSYTGGKVDANSLCTIQLDVMSPPIGGVLTNISGDLTSSLGNSGPASASLTVIDDPDGDAIPNVDDNCPNVSNNDQADLDQDGLGNVCDSDIDGDMMPNSFETQNGLNPFNSFDQRGDADGDGFNNLEEFRFNTDPNIADSDEDGNGIPDIVDMRRMLVPPTIITPLLLDAAQ